MSAMPSTPGACSALVRSGYVKRLQVALSRARRACAEAEHFLALIDHEAGGRWVQAHPILDRLRAVNAEVADCVPDGSILAAPRPVPTEPSQATTKHTKIARRIEK